MQPSYVTAAVLLMCVIAICLLAVVESQRLLYFSRARIRRLNAWGRKQVREHRTVSDAQGRLHPIGNVTQLRSTADRIARLPYTLHTTQEGPAVGTGKAGIGHITNARDGQHSLTQRQMDALREDFLQRFHAGNTPAP